MDRYEKTIQRLVLAQTERYKKAPSKEHFWNDYEMRVHYKLCELRRRSTTYYLPLK